jgi:hypothetical protein
MLTRKGARRNSARKASQFHFLELSKRAIFIVRPNFRIYTQARIDDPALSARRTC